MLSAIILFVRGKKTLVNLRLFFSIFMPQLFLDTIAIRLKKENVTLFTIKNYVLVKDLEEAYVLNQKRSNVILGGMMWLKMNTKGIQTAIDLSGLGLDKIEQTEDAFEIGCMVTLHDIECKEDLNQYFNGVIAKSVKYIVGVQFRNSATIGGSIFARYGFSDILTCFLALDTYVELYKGGVIPLSEFVAMPANQDVLIKIIVKKDARKVSYLTHRRTATDFPVLTCAVVKTEKQWQVVLGARPSRAKLIMDELTILGQNPTQEQVSEFISYMEEKVEFASNMRGSEEYRRHLAGVLIRRGIKEIIEGKGAYSYGD
jgi:CO/xanthine dehydrogenase FAD-binding subunit